MTMLAVFRSRAQALDALSALRSAGVPARAVSTPREAGVGCGVSLAFGDALFARVQRILLRRRYTAFWGYLRACGGTYLRV